MKKIVLLLCVLAVILGLCMTVSAEENEATYTKPIETTLPVGTTCEESIAPTQFSTEVSDAALNDSSSRDVMITTILSSVVISAAVSGIFNLFATAAAGKIAVKAAREAAKNEIDKLQHTWNREDTVSYDEEFDQMTTAVAKYIWSGGLRYDDKAMAMVAVLRSKVTGELAQTLDSLYTSIQLDQVQLADQHLSEAIEIKRKNNNP